MTRIPGPTAGRVFHRMRLRAQEETTAQVAGCYPFVVERGFGADGAYIGRDRYTRGAFRFDPFADRSIGFEDRGEAAQRVRTAAANGSARVTKVR